MGLTRVDKERIEDSRMKLRSVANSLQQISTKGIDGMDEIEECIKDAEKSLKGALQGESKG
jgi:hypothetical protein